MNILASGNLRHETRAICRSKILWALLFWLTFTTSAMAHKVYICAWVEGDTVFTESKFSGGKAVKGGDVKVLDTSGTLLLEGNTDDEGAFSFPVPKIADLTIHLDASAGHQATWAVSAEELTGGDPDPPEAVATAPAGKAEGEAAPAVPGLTAREIEEIVARQLNEKLRPLNRMMANAQESGPSLSDIFGGLGYILGLVGLGAYIRFRKERGRP